MATAMAHLVTGAAMGVAAAPRGSRAVVALGLGLASMLPDIDVLAFNLGIPYGHPLGHRGLTHSIPFAVVAALLAGFAAWSLRRWLAPGKDHAAGIGGLAALGTFAALLLHDCLDALTTGGLGVGFFIPFSAERYFFPWRFIPVSPIDLRSFLPGARPSWGLAVLSAEARLVMEPAITIAVASAALRTLGGALQRRLAAARESTPEDRRN